MDQKTDHTLELGKYDESELIELVETDAYGASTPVISAISATISAASAFHICPTETCTDSC